MRMTQEQISSLYGQSVQDRNGNKIGRIGQVWADATGQPTWVSVKTGIFGMRESMVPIQDARMEQDRMSVPFDKGMVQGAPHIDASEFVPLNSDQIDQLYAHYQLGPAPHPTGQQPAPAAKPSPGLREELTRSEERLRVGKESQPAGTARLRKYVVTEDAHATVPIEHDEVRLEREPVTAEERGGVRAPIGEEEREFELRAERPVVSKEQVPVERVRMTKDEVTEDRPIDERVRREMIEADFPEGTRRTR